MSVRNGQWIPCAIVRGGTSKGVFFLDQDLPEDRSIRDRLILRAFGSPDVRQIDGLGGADPLTSKCVIVGTGRAGYDLEYTFVQVGIDQPHADYGSVCGNLSAALGHFGIQSGLLAAEGKISKARVYVTNADAWLEVFTPVYNGLPVVEGDFRIPGVPGSGAEVVVNLAGLAGARLGAVFPTGRRSELLEVPEVGEYEVTLMDVGNPHVFVAASDFGLKGTESAVELDADRELLGRLERLRATAAYRLAMCTSPESATSETPAAPILGIVAPPRDYVTATHERVAADWMDLTARLQFMQRTHRTYAGTSTACTGVAVRTPGTLPAAVARRSDAGSVRIGHPCGVVSTRSAVVDDGIDLTVEQATVSRTARIIMTGQVAIPCSYTNRPDQ